MHNRLAAATVACLMGGLVACSTGSPPAASKIKTSATRTAVPVIATVRAQRIGGTGRAYLVHSGTDGFKLVGGSVESPLLGHGKFVEDGLFATSSAPPAWGADATITVADGDTIMFTSVGGVKLRDTLGDPHSTTTDTITGGTGKFSGATGTMHTVGVTQIVGGNGKTVAQLYKFGFHGTITLRRSATKP
jgi:hypothetical protein